MTDYTRLQLRRGTAASWSSSNSILAEGEQALETDTLRVKVGNGITPYNSLPYLLKEGPQGIQGIQGVQGVQGPQGEPGSFGGAVFTYNYLIDTADTDPGSGNLKFDNALTTATQLFINKIDINSIDNSAYLETIDDSTSAIKGHFKVSVVGEPDDFVYYAINGEHYLDAGVYYEIPILYLSGSITTLTNNSDVTITFVRTGDKGDKGDQGDKGDKGDTGDTGPIGPVGAGYAITSSTSGTFSVTTANMVVNFAVSSIGAYIVGDRVRLVGQTNGSVFYGTVYSLYPNLTPPEMYINLDQHEAATENGWKISLSGLKGADGTSSSPATPTVPGVFYGHYDTSGNLGLGKNALDNITTGINNVVINTSTNISTGGRNVIIGSASANQLNSFDNVVVGYGSLTSATSGSGNIVIGNSSLQSSNGSNNIVIGGYAGYGHSGSNTLFIGQNGYLQDPLIVGGLTSTDSYLKVNGKLRLTSATAEKTTISTTGFSGYSFDLSTQAIVYITANSTADGEVTFSWSSGSRIEIGESATVVLLLTNGATAYRPTSFVVFDGNNQTTTVKWQNAVPSAGTPSAIDSYTFTILRTGSTAYTIFASQAKFV